MPTNRQLIADFAAGKTSIVMHTQQRLQQVEAINPKINALVTPNPDALSQAHAADRLRNNNTTLPPLFGLPITVKDVYATQGLRTTAGFKPLHDYVPQQDAELVARLKAAGTILLGKTNTAELGGDIQCHNTLFGITNNPWDISRTSGGSSGGSAAAVAADFSALDIGSDLAGSIRIPAAFCGVAGLKATENRLPRTGHIPHLPNRTRSVWHMLSLGLLAPYIDDLRLGFSVLAGADGQDSTVPPLPIQETRPKNQLKIAYWDDFNGLPLCPRTRQGLQQTIATLQKAGFTVERTKPQKFDFPTAWQAYGEILGVEMGLGMPNLLRLGFATAGFIVPASNFLMKHVSSGMRLNMRRYHHALNIREQLIAELEAFLNQWDVWLCPAVTTVAFPHSKPSLLGMPKIPVGQHLLPYLEAATALAVPFSLTGSPVVSLPAGIFDGLPVGVQLVGKRWQDEALLDAAEAIEQVIQGFTQPKWS